MKCSCFFEKRESVLCFADFCIYFLSRIVDIKYFPEFMEGFYFKWICKIIPEKSRCDLKHLECYCFVVRVLYCLTVGNEVAP